MPPIEEQPFPPWKAIPEAMGMSRYKPFSVAEVGER
jgi:hypothetical protein